MVQARDAVGWRSEGIQLMAKLTFFFLDFSLDTGLALAGDLDGDLPPLAAVALDGDLAFGEAWLLLLGLSLASVLAALDARVLCETVSEESRLVPGMIAILEVKM